MMEISKLLDLGPRFFSHLVTGSCDTSQPPWLEFVPATPTDCQLKTDAFSSFLGAMGISLSNAQASLLLASLDSNKNGMLSWTEIASPTNTSDSTSWILFWYVDHLKRNVAPGLWSVLGPWNTSYWI